ncbi:MAG: hypothetical protein LQ346_007624 [Caloplaca aetnensis]|nr:MAG: hypothetical protein LQ346_007624 [Caloplaca aetnensis]
MAGRPQCQIAIRGLCETVKPRVHHWWKDSHRTFSSSICRPKSQQKPRRVTEDSYAYHHSQQRKEANVARQTQLREERSTGIGDPIRGVPTPFVESLGSALPPVTTTSDEELANATPSLSPERPPPSPAFAADENHLNYYITKPEIEGSLDYSRVLSEPLVSVERERADPVKEAEEAKAHEAGHNTAYEAISRIVSLGNANNKERTRANIQRIIDTFGRHNTDSQLKPKAPSLQSTYSTIAELTPTPRAGPDTGSSEVQIGILTAKIRVLADRYEGPNRNDKVNKRNLRLLLHRRQKLLKYMHKKERGSQRWTHMIEKLGLTEATWKGQIAVE